ncbi:MAG: MFS transporter [Anaerolineaceae bacterium]|nr:MFS transporter [Anaerolineaceae bacterium]
MEESALPMRQLSSLATVTGLLSFVLIGGAQALYGPSLPVFTENFGLPAGAAGLLVSVHNAGVLLGVASAIPLANRSLARWRVGLACALLAVGALLIGFGLSWLLTLAGGLIIGLAYGALTIGLNSLYAVGYGRRSPGMVNLLNAIFGVGAILSPLLFLLDFANSRMPFFVLAGFGAALVPLGLMMDDRLPTRATELRPRQNRGILLAFIALLGFGVGVEVSTIGYAATYLLAVGVSADGAAAATSLFFLMFTASRLAVIPLSLRLRPYQIVLGSLGLTTLLLAVANLPPLATVAVVLLGASLGTVFPNCFNWLNQAFGATSGTVYILAGSLVGGMVVPAVVAQIIPLAGESSIMLTLAGISVLTLLMGILIKVRLAT